MQAFFKEESRLNPIFLWLYVLVGVFPMIFILFYPQYAQENNVYDDKAYSFVSVMIPFILIIVGFFMFSTKLKLEIRESTLRFKCFPFILNWKVVDPQNIKEWQVKKINPILYAGGWGYRRRFFQRKVAMIMKGKKGLEIKLKNGKTYFFSSSKPESLDREMKKLMN